MPVGVGELDIPMWLTVSSATLPGGHQTRPLSSCHPWLLPPLSGLGFGTQFSPVFGSTNPSSLPGFPGAFGPSGSCALAGGLEKIPKSFTMPKTPRPATPPITAPTGPNQLPAPTPMTRGLVPKRIDKTQRVGIDIAVCINPPIKPIGSLSKYRPVPGS
jgi:hypothetical protein